jgi:hypothetical protein
MSLLSVEQKDPGCDDNYSCTKVSGSRTTSQTQYCEENRMEQGMITWIHSSKIKIIIITTIIIIIITTTIIIIIIIINTTAIFTVIIIITYVSLHCTFEVRTLDTK